MDCGFSRSCFPIPKNPQRHRRMSLNEIQSQEDEIAYQSLLELFHQNELEHEREQLSVRTGQVWFWKAYIPQLFLMMSNTPLYSLW